MTAESARVIAGAEKNSPTMTINNKRKNVFCMSCKKEKKWLHVYAFGLMGIIEFQINWLTGNL